MLCGHSSLQHTREARGVISCTSTDEESRGREKLNGSTKSDETSLAAGTGSRKGPVRGFLSGWGDAVMIVQLFQQPLSAQHQSVLEPLLCQQST